MPDIDTQLDSLLALYHQCASARDVLAKDELGHFHPLRLVEAELDRLTAAIKALFAPATADGEST